VLVCLTLDLGLSKQTFNDGRERVIWIESCHNDYLRLDSSGRWCVVAHGIDPGAENLAVDRADHLIR
jgi:hypothetical protein